MADYTRWANRDTRRSFSGFLSESGQFMSGDPAMIANQNGWTGDNFGWYRDNTGKVVARSVGGKMVVYDGDQQQTTPAQTDMGNPAITAGQKPAERARTMGLQSNGKGGYVDDSGQVVARTVNGELVFYDDKGGAVTDGAGGQALTQSSPSWVDPDSGLILVPPAQPETPEEKASTPDPLPATPPMGFDLFITQKHKKAKADAEAQRQAEAEQQQKAQEQEEFYSQTSGSQLFFSKAKQILDAALKSGSQEKEYAAGMLTQYLEDEQEEVMNYFTSVPEEGQQELAVEALKTLINRAKREALLSQYEGMDGENGERLKAMEADGRDGEYMDSGPTKLTHLIPTVLKYNEPNPNNLIKDKKLTVSGNNTNWEIHNDGKMKEGAMEAIKKLGGSVPEELNNLDSALENHYEPAQYLDVTWGVKDGAKETTDNRMIALDAMKTWRKDILPNLPVGSVVSATPDVFRAGLSSIYKKAGFGSVGDSTTLNGVVMIVDGEKVMVPISDEMEEEFRLEKYYLNQLNEGISIERELFIAEMVFDDFV